jgi:MFS family permease
MRPSSRALLSAIAISATGGVPALLLGSVGVQVKADIALSDTQLGAAIATFFLVAMLASATMGRVIDAIGWRTALRLLASLTALSLILIAGTGRAFLPLALALALGGLAFSGASASSNLAVAQGVPRERHGLALGIKQGAVPLSTFFTGLSVPFVALTIGWRWAFVIALLLPLITLLTIPAPDGPTPAERRSLRSALVGALPGSGARAPLVGPDLVAERRLWSLALAGGLASIGVGALNGFTVITVVDSGVEPGTAGFLVAAAGILSALSRVVLGWLADRRPEGTFVLVGSLLAFGVVGYLMLATISPATAVPAVAIAFAAGWGWPGLFHFGIISAYSRTPGRATGVIQAGFAGGLIAGPGLFGLLSDLVGYGFAWSVNAALAGVASIMVLRLRPRGEPPTSTPVRGSDAPAR